MGAASAAPPRGVSIAQHEADLAGLERIASQLVLPNPVVPPGPGRGVPRVVGASQMAQDGSTEAPEKPNLAPFLPPRGSGGA
eukprot:6506374-Pyramimonas_sp.AAC.1